MTTTTYRPKHQAAHYRKTWAYDLVKRLALSVGLPIDDFIEAVDGTGVVVTAEIADIREK